MIKKIISALIFCFFAIAINQAQTALPPMSDSTAKKAPIAPVAAPKPAIVAPIEPQVETGGEYTDVSTIEILRASIFLIFTLTLIGILTFARVRGAISAKDYYRLCTIMLLLNACITLVFVGVKPEQITPVVGIIGSLAGYVFGATHNSSSGESSEKPVEKK